MRDNTIIICSTSLACFFIEWHFATLFFLFLLKVRQRLFLNTARFFIFFFRCCLKCFRWVSILYKLVQQRQNTDIQKAKYFIVHNAFIQYTSKDFLHPKTIIGFVFFKNVQDLFYCLNCLSTESTRQWNGHIM